MSNINTKQYWDDRFENNWDEMMGKDQTAFFANLFVQSMSEWLADEIKQEKLSICDFGCAAGQAVHFLYEKFDTKVTGIDFSEKAIEQAKKLYPDLDFFCLDITSADRKDFYADIGYTSNVLEHLDRPWKAAVNISHYVNKYLMILIPFRESVKISEHCNIFDIYNIPMVLGEFDLSYVDEIDCTKLQGTLVATFGFGDGTCIKPIMMKRKLSQEGATAKARVVDSEAMEAFVYRMVELLKPVGPTNFQFRYDNDSGKYLLLEVNPRISSSTSLRAAFGYNEAQMCMEYFIEHIRPQDAVVRKGSAVRYIADYVHFE